MPKDTVLVMCVHSGCSDKDILCGKKNVRFSPLGGIPE